LQHATPTETLNVAKGETSMFKSLSDVGAEIKTRQHVSKVPPHHDLIPGRIFSGTTGGPNAFDFELRVSPSTTNGHAITACEKRIADAVSDRRAGRPIGQYSTDIRAEQSSKACVYMTFALGEERFRFKIEAEGMSSYKLNGEYEMNLKNAVQNVIHKAEMHMARKMGAQRQSAVSEPTMSSGYRM
jgi:hypothetical protein